MPSLSALKEFRNSFNNIANEKNDVLSRDTHFDELTLPDNEPTPSDLSGQEAPPPADNSANNTADTSSGGFDLNSFLNSLPGKSQPDQPAEEESLPDDITPEPPPDEKPISGASSNDINEAPSDSSSDDLLSSDDFSMVSPESQPEGAESGDFGAEDFGTGDFGSEDFGTGDFGTGDFGSEDLGTGDLGVDNFGSEDLGSVDFGTGDFGSDVPAAADDNLLDDSAFNISDDATLPNDDELPDIDTGKSASFGGEDSGDFELEPLDEMPDLGTPESGSLDQDLSIDDSLPDLGLPSDSSEGDMSFDGSLPDLGLPSDDDSLPDLDFPSESSNEDFSLDDSLPDLGFPDSNASAAGADSSLQDMDFPDFDSPHDETPIDGSLPDLDFPSSDASPEDTPFDGSLPDLDFPSSDSSSEETPFDGSLPDLDFPSSDSSPEETPFDGSLPDLDFPDSDSSLPDLDFPEIDSSQNDTALPGADFNLDGEPGELPELGDLGDDFSSDTIDIDSGTDDSASPAPAEDAGNVFGSDDFSLDGLDEILDKNKTKTAPPPAPKKGVFGKKKPEAQEPEPEDVEEIRLSQDDLDTILKTLSGYPLNLRVACEEMIAEMVLIPQQLSKVINLLVNGAYPKEMAALASEIMGKEIVVPKSFQKSTGAELEDEKSRFAYIFVHNFLPVLRLFAVIAALSASVIYLAYTFIYIPLKAESIYKRGYERIFAGEYQRANTLFHEAFVTHRKKEWFYKYAEAFRDQRRYLPAESKYEELLRYYPRDKKGVLDYADLQTNYLLNYDKANKILQQQLLDYAPNDPEGLLAAGDNFFAWADSDPARFYDRYEDARYSYARVLEKYGWQPPVVERMMKYFIRTDNLLETLNLRNWFDADDTRRLSPEAIAELGGYLLDKQLEEVKGVPNPYVESIESVRAMLIQAVREKPNLPEPHYQLARYYKSLNNTYEERLTLENAIRAFDLAESEPVRRRLQRVDTHYRYANLLVNNREFFPAERELVRGIELYEDFLNRNLISASPQLGQLYAAKGDLEYFVKAGDMNAALNDYRRAERYGYSPPEIQYRMGAANYQLENWGSALEYMFKASADLPLNYKLLHALGNTTYKRGDYFAAQGYFDRLLNILENQRARLPVLLPNDRPEFLELGERLMMARNNAGVVYEALADTTGNRDYRSRALSLYAESARAWDSITRNPESMARMRLGDTPNAPGVNLGFLNVSNAIRPASGFNPEIFIRIDKDVLDPSHWEELAPFGGLVN